MVDVGVGEEDSLNDTGGYGDGDVFKYIPALLHAAVNEILFSTDLQQGAASGDLVGGTDELNFQ